MRSLAPDLSRTVLRAAGLLAGLAVLLPSPAHAIVDVEGDDASFRLLGSARTFTLFLAPRPIDGAPTPDAEAVVLQRLRIGTLSRFADLLELEVAWDVMPVISTGGGQSSIATGFVTAPRSPLHLWDLDPVLTTEQNFEVRHDLDRLSLALELPFMDLRVGRQAIGHGTARIFSPTDVFGTFSTVSLDTEYKRGVDAVRLTVPIGDWMEAEAIAVGHENTLADGIYLARWRATFSPVDLSLLAGTSYGEPTFAVDLAADVGGTGLYAEALIRLPLDDTRRLADTVRATIGADTYFDVGLDLTVEAHYNGPGVHDAADFPAALATLEAQAGEATLLGEWYTAVSLSYEITPLWRAQLLWLANWDDPSSLVAPSLSWDFSEESVVAIGALIGIGEGPEAATPLPGLTFTLPRSELGTTPTTAWAEVRLYF